ncbi:MAG: enoyl-CoA hydratase/isomerase family protein [Chloroflexi bacterium]|nr:enoyl-CoA hydratase/isomerase family protein [Chloroflexota bacterium]
MAYDRIALQESGHITTLILNRPDKFNAMDIVFLREFKLCMEELTRDDETRVIVITGAGRSFCPGLDVEIVGKAAADPVGSGMGMGTLDQPFALSQNVPDALRACHKPVIAAVNGAAAGIGLALACLCDYRIASEQATFTAGLIKLGLAAELGLTYILPRLVPLPVALEFLSTGEKRDAKWAEKVGLVRQVVSAEELMNSANTLAGTLASMPPIAMRMLKQMLYESLESSYDVQIRTEGYAASMLAQTQDHKEGILASLITYVWPTP